jgi:hypothetical protein
MYAVSLTADQRVKVGSALGNCKAIVSDFIDFTTTKPDGHLEWNAGGYGIRNPGPFEPDITTDYEEDSEGFWGDSPELYFDISDADVGKWIPLTVTAGPFNYTLSLLPGFSSTTTYYFSDTVDVLVVDPHTNAGFNVEPTSGLITTRDGGTDQFSVCLKCQPTAPVTVPVYTSNNQEGKVSDLGVSPVLCNATSISFDQGNWDIPHYVTVTGVPDSHLTKDVKYKIKMGPTVSLDRDYNKKYPSSVSVTNVGPKIVITVSNVNLIVGGPGFAILETADIHSIDDPDNDYANIRIADEQEGLNFNGTSCSNNFTLTDLSYSGGVITSKSFITNHNIYEFTVWLSTGFSGDSVSATINVKLYNKDILIDEHSRSFSCGPEGLFVTWLRLDLTDNTYIITEL